MGTPINPPGPGTACARCWGSNDSKFGVGDPPSVLTVVASGIVKGGSWIAGDGEPPNGTYSVGDDGACAFEQVAAPWIVRVVFSFETNFSITKPDLTAAFSGSSVAECGTIADNTLPAGAKFKDGTMKIISL